MTTLERFDKHLKSLSDDITKVLDKFQDLRTIIGKDGQNLAFLQASSYENLEVFIGFIIQFSEVFQQVIERLPDDQFAALCDIVDRARMNRK